MSTSKQIVHSQSRFRNSSVSPRRQTCSCLFDSDLLSDESDKTASHPGCWLISITVDSGETVALIEKGASVTVMGRPLCQKIQLLGHLRHTRETPHLEGVGGNPVPTLGHTEVEVAAGTGHIRLQ